MRVILCDNYDEMSYQASRLIESQLILKPDSVLGLATGSTPIGTYKKLIEKNQKGDIDFSRVTTFNLDEYYPISQSNDQSYRYFMNDQLFSHVNIDINKTHVPNGEAEDPERECLEYESEIDACGGIDLQLLGIGVNGHIGFNEPDTNLNSFTHLTELTESTITANSRFFESEDDVPRKAITMGIASILKSKKIILLASGTSKSRVVSELLNGCINTSIPATLLKVHPDVVLICDKDAYFSTRLGVDIGGTNTKFAVLSGEDVLYKGSVPTCTDSEDALIDGICNEIIRIREKYPINAVGIGTPGIIKDGCVTAANLPLQSSRMANRISQKISLPVKVDNDANCAVLGEYRFSCSDRYKNIVMLTVGTGIGSGIIADGMPACRMGINSEIGHTVIQADGGIPCACGKCGCLERYASVSALIEQAKKACENAPNSLLADMYSKKGKMDGECVFDAYKVGCPTAHIVVDNYIRYLCIGIRNVKFAYSPDAVILAGGIIANEGDLILSLLKKELSDDVCVEISKLHNDAGALGAALL